MVGGHDRHAALFQNGRNQTTQLQVQGLHGGDGRFEVARVPHHVSVGVVHAQVLVLAGFQGGQQGIGDLGGFHPGPLLEGHHVGRHFHVGLQTVGELAGAIAVPEVGHVAVLLGFGNGELAHAGTCQEFTQGAVDGRRLHQKARGDLQIAVVLHHAGEGDLGQCAAREPGELFFRQGPRDLDGAIAAEVEEHHRVAVDDLSDGGSVLGDDKSRQILVDDLGLGAEGLDGFLGRAERAAFAQDMDLPTAVHHAPIGLVAIHGDVHASAAGSDGHIEGGSAQPGQERFEGLHVFQRGGFTHVAAIQQDVYAHLGGTICLGALDHRFEVVDVAVHIAIGEQAQKVEGSTLLGGVQNILPRLALPDGTGRNGIGDQLGALREHAPSTQSVVTHLGIAHVVVGRQSHRQTVSSQFGPRVLGHHAVQYRSAGSANRVALSFGKTDSVHHDGDDRALVGSEADGLFQFHALGSFVRKTQGFCFWKMLRSQPKVSSNRGSQARVLCRDQSSTLERRVQ